MKNKKKKNQSDRQNNQKFIGSSAGKNRNKIQSIGPFPTPDNQKQIFHFSL